MVITYKKYENDIIEDFYAVLVEDSVRGGIPLRDAQKQAKRFASHLPKYNAELLQEMYDLYKKGQHTLEESQDYTMQILLQQFCQNHGMETDAAEYLMNLREELLEEKNGYVSFIKFSEHALTYYLRAICYGMNEQNPDLTQEELLEEANKLTLKAQEAYQKLLQLEYEAYKKGENSLAVGVDKALKLMLKETLQSDEKVEHILDLLIQGGGM